ncbi:MAG TPA: hypothetical protein VIL01_08765 [Thermomicrobiales bacterium]
MTWLSWRLHRTEAAIGSALFAGLILLMAVGIRSITAAFEAAKNVGCFDSGEIASSQACQPLLSTYWLRISRWDNLTAFLHAVPLALAVLLLIPTLQDLERGTVRLAWTQSITRGKWAIHRGLFLIAIAVFVTAIWAPVALWWYDSLHQDGSDQPTPRFAQWYFDFSPPVLLGYSLFALALALALTVALRRLVPVLALTGVGFVATRFFVANQLRPRFRTPVERISVPSRTETVAPYSPEDWVFDEWWVTPAGDRISLSQFHNELCRYDGTGSAEDFFYQCVADNGLKLVTALQPANRFWQFQTIETALYCGLAAVLLTFAYWWVRRRIA